MLCFPMLISSLPGANPLPPEHKIGIFVRFCPPEPQFSGISSTKSRFLCFFALRNPRFRASRAQNRHFCALWWGHGRGDGREQREQREQQEQQELQELHELREQCEQLEQRQQQEQQEQRPGQFGLLTFCHKGALFELWHSI